MIEDESKLWKTTYSIRKRPESAAAIVGTEVSCSPCPADGKPLEEVTVTSSPANVTLMAAVAVQQYL